MKIVQFLLAAGLVCTFMSCSKDLVTEPETAVSTEDSSNALVKVRILNQDSVTVNVDANIGGYLASKPSDYNSTTKRYPLMVFLHGHGAFGNGSSDLYKITYNAIPKLIQKGTFPKSFTVGTKSYSFIVVSPQFKQTPSASDISKMIDFAVKKYRVDTTRIYLAGISMGGGAVMDFLSAYPKKAAAAVTMAQCRKASSSGAKAIASAKLSVWGFHNDLDPYVPSDRTKGFINMINSDAPIIPSKKTIFPNIKEHNCWATACDPGYKENNVNIYQWLLKYHR